MPRLKFDRLPAAESPLDVIKQDLGDRYQRIRMESANASYALDQQKSFMKPDAYKQSRFQLDSKIDSELYRLRLDESQVKNRVSQIEGFIQQRKISPEEGQRALWELAAPGTIKRPSKPRAPFSPSMLRSYRPDIMGYADAAVDKKGLEWGPPAKTRQSLLQQYMRWRDGVAYEELSPTNQRLLDNEWDSLMRGDDTFKEWWSDKNKRTPIAEATSLRSTGRLNSSIKNRVLGSALSEGRQASPMDKSIKKTLSSYYKIPRDERPQIWDYKKKKEKPVPTPEQLQRLNTEQAFNEGVKLGYWQ